MGRHRRRKNRRSRPINRPYLPRQGEPTDLDDVWVWIHSAVARRIADWLPEPLTENKLRLAIIDLWQYGLTNYELIGEAIIESPISLEDDVPTVALRLGSRYEHLDAVCATIKRYPAKTRVVLERKIGRTVEADLCLVAGEAEFYGQTANWHKYFYEILKKRG